MCKETYNNNNNTNTAKTGVSVEIHDMVVNGNGIIVKIRRFLVVSAPNAREDGREFNVGPRGLLVKRKRLKHNRGGTPTGGSSDRNETFTDKTVDIYMYRYTYKVAGRQWWRQVFSPGTANFINPTRPADPSTILRLFSHRFSPIFLFRDRPIVFFFFFSSRNPPVLGTKPTGIRRRHRDKKPTIFKLQ